MTVADLKQLLKNAHDDMEVLIPVSMEFDGRFVSPCIAESGIGELALDEDGDEKEKSFLIVPHGFFEEKHGVPPELN